MKKLSLLFFITLVACFNAGIQASTVVQSRDQTNQVRLMHQLRRLL